MTIREAYEKGYRDGEHDGYFSIAIKRGIEPNAYCPPEEEQVERAKGKWVLIDKELSRYQCPKCGEIIRLYKKNEISYLDRDETINDYPFSHCGLDMRGGEWMKLVIEIDEDTYKDIKKGKVYSSVRDVPQESVVAIANGKPLNELLDEIRAEIIEKAKGTMNDTRAEGLYMALNIVDKYKAESGDKR